jgi:RNA-splicing ligase RtcB
VIADYQQAARDGQLQRNDYADELGSRPTSDRRSRAQVLAEMKEPSDEVPMAYKDIDALMQVQDDLVEDIHTLKQVVCVKGRDVDVKQPGRKAAVTAEHGRIR